MSEQARTHLRQARSFLQAGDLPKAIALLENAVALAAIDPDVHRAALLELAGAYEKTGRGDLANRCADQIKALGQSRGPKQPLELADANPTPSPARGHWISIGRSSYAGRATGRVGTIASHLLVAAISGLAVWIWMGGWSDRRRANNAPSPSAPTTLPSAEGGMSAQEQPDQTPLARLAKQAEATTRSFKEENLKLPPELAAEHERILSEIQGLGNPAVPKR